MTNDNLANLPRLVKPYPDPIPNVIPFGSLTLFAGAPKRGKTSLIAQWAKRWMNGQSICGLPTNKPTDFAIITNDHKWAINQGRWFEKVGYPEVKHYALRDDPNTIWKDLLNPEGRTKILRRSLDAVKLERGGLLVLDVAGPFITNQLNDYNAVLAGIGYMTQVLDEYQVTTIGPSHMGKQKNNAQEQYKEPHERILGSGAQIGFCDTTLWLLGPTDLETEYYQIGWLPTHAPAGSFNLIRSTEDGLFEPYQGPETAEQLSMKLAQVLALIPENGIARKELEIRAKVEHNISRTSVNTYLAKLQQYLRVFKNERGIYCRRQLSLRK